MMEEGKIVKKNEIKGEENNKEKNYEREEWKIKMEYESISTCLEGEGSDKILKFG